MLQIQHIKKEYKTGDLVQKALDDVSLNLRDNEFVAVLGPSGSGKTTLLNIIGGLDRYDSGNLIINGISTKKYRDRDWDSYRNHTIGFVFQSYNLIPHQSVLANVELALTISGIGKEERRRRAIKALEEVGLGDQLHKKPNQMSGGQMQRVAIARALVNDPDILLADEPTGALDSETSIQVMDLLKKVAEDRLVVMVTHNPELAQKYATRIVALRDGKIRSDSDPFEPEKDSLAEPQHKNMGKASMSFLTALSLSFNNLKTKKARTILTSFAGSIGIIGIALILSLSTGVNRYIETVETETLSQYPLQIQSTGIDLTSMLTDMGSAAESEGDGAASGNSEKAGDDINVIDMLSGMFATVNSNDLTALKDYLENGGSGIEQYTSAIEYSYDTDPLIFGKTDGGYRQVNPDTSFEALGFGSSSGANSMMSTMMSTDMFYQMPEDPDLYQSQYDVKAGRWPQNYNECVLVLTQNGNISDFMLYTLGLRDYRELDDMIQQFINEESVTVPESSGSYSYEEILDISFKLVNAADMYEYDSRYGVWKDKEDDKDYMNSLIEKGEEIKIVGIVQPSEDANGLMLMAGIGYPASLTEHVAEQAAQSEIVKEQIADRTVNVFTGESFGSENESGGPDLSGLFSIDTSKLQSAFKVDEQALSSAMEDIFADAAASGGGSISTETIQQMMAGMFASYLQTPEASAIVAGGIAEMIQANGGMTISAEQMQSLMTEIMQGYQLYAQQNGYTDPARFGEYLAEYMETAEAEAVINSWTEENFGSMESMTPDPQLMSKMTAQLMAGYMEYARSAAGSAEIPGTDAGMAVDTDAMASEMAAAMENAITIDENAFAESFKMDMDGDELTELMMSMSGSESATAESNLRSLGYVDFDDPSMISIYPLDFESKEQVSRILDEYNEDMKASGNEEKAVTYTDIVGAMMSSVTTIIDVISYVLIAFVAISLIVSSIMIGVITYISVLERQKEIGILRAIGASKGNISQVFNAETFIIGLCAGIMGIATSLLILIPGNALIHHLAGTNDVSAVLPAIPAVILILLSVVLTLIGGIIPSRKAAKSDPVTALRTE
ncbi:MAG: ABC transporter ATP-binding protein/permease [Anaerovoracaceae bacterium]|nr:ABC transporter ATP-binding protein/permease [Anaerovoracaceae bacterium]